MSIDQCQNNNRYNKKRNNLRYGVHRNLMTFSVRFLHRGIIGVFVRNEERGFDVASIGVFALTVEYLFVQLDVIVIYSVVKSYGDHLRNFFRWKVIRNSGTVF